MLMVARGRIPCSIRHMDYQAVPHDLFRDLRTVSFDGDKEDEWENATDLLEIAAVAAGLKPAHLSGAGTRGLTVQLQLEAISSAHGLYAMYTPPPAPWRPRPSRLPPELQEFLAARKDIERARISSVLWIYRDEDVADLIPNAVSGASSVAQVLGYPDCCVTSTAERSLQIHEALYGCYWEMASGSIASVEDMIIRDVEVDLDIPMPNDLFSPDFPFIQFCPCACRGKTPSPSRKINAGYEKLARALDPSFADRIAALARRK